MGVVLTEVGNGFEITSGFARPCTASAADHRTIWYMISKPLPIATSQAPMYRVLRKLGLAFRSRSRVNGEYNPNAKHRNILNWKNVIGFM